VLIIEKRGENSTTDITVLINCCGQNFPAMLLKPSRVVRSTSKKRYSKWGFTDYHKPPLSGKNHLEVDKVVCTILFLM